MRNYLQLLQKNPDFTRLWSAQVISLFGDWFSTIALLSLVAAYSPDAYKGLAVSGLLLARSLPPMLISPIAGVLIDRFDRKRLLVWSNWLRSVVVLLLVLTTHSPQWLWAIYVLTVLQFTLSSVFEPGQSAVIPNLVKGDNLVTANTLLNVTWSSLLAFGAAAGGLVSATFGATTALLIDSVTFLVAGWLLTGIERHKFRAVARVDESLPPDDTSFREGLRFLRRNRAIAATLLVKFGSSLGNIDTLMTIYATQLFILGSGGQLSLGIMYSAFGVGAIAGPILLNRFNDGSVNSMRRLIIVGFIWCALGWLVLGGAVSLVIVCAGLLLRAMGGSANWTYSTIVIQKLVPDSYLGRVFSLDMGMFYVASVLSTVVHGSLIDALGVERIGQIAVGTMVVSLVPLVLWILLTRRLGRRPAADRGVVVVS